MSPLEITLIVAGIGVGLAILAFWVWMLVDCLRREGPADLDRVLWIVVIVFLKPLGAAIYYFLEYRRRSHGALPRSA